MPEQTIKVQFPCIHGLAAGQLVTINCFASDELKGTIKVVTGVDEEVAGRIIGASRYGETDPRAGLGVMALFSTPFFSGESYGLALALADKLARLGMTEQWSEIYATGALPADGCGRVAAIGDFPDKLELLCRRAQPGSLFIYPQDNLGSDDEQIAEMVHGLQRKGVRCIAIEWISELEDRVWPTVTSAASPSLFDRLNKQLSNFASLSRIALLVLLLAGAAALSFFLFTGSSDNTSQLTDGNKGGPRSSSFSALPHEERPNSHQEPLKEQTTKDSEEGVPRVSGTQADEFPTVSKMKTNRDIQRTSNLESVDVDPSVY